MEDILASIRRILHEDEAQPDGTTAPPAVFASPPPVDHGPDDVLLLEPSMMVPEPPPTDVARQPDPAPPVALVAPEAAAAAASSVGSLVRSIIAERSMQVHSGGPTIEDIVRGELRPLLKQWLDEHLPPMVERVVRSEMERVIGRALS